ncbi:hypothetical protein [Candidatus Fokinia crypta]|uniref:Transposase n=1 Tax=Candidatus Fokinia crypta TaxID=1920990 RepID=A0ABZ0URG9_9RICK|nr:hypothetical protein [Candidatus Fokinia cryptica]WPX98162.1 hypothetical protein Fokcrypt_00703 [Candidatus Fokinia cryptica]
MLSGVFTSNHDKQAKQSQHNYFKIEKFTFVRHIPFTLTEQLQSEEFIKSETLYNIIENNVNMTSLEQVAGVQYKEVECHYRRGHLCKGKKRRSYYRRGHYYNRKR